SNAKILLTSRIVMLLIGILTIFITLWQPPSIFWIAVFASTIFVASWTPVTIASVFSNKVTKEGAFWSILVGFVCVFVLALLISSEVISLPGYLHPVIISGLVSLFTLIIISKFTVPTQAQMEFQKKLLIQPESEYDERKIKSTNKY